MIPQEPAQIQVLDMLPFWPSLVLCYDLEDLRKVNLLITKIRKHHVLPDVIVEVGSPFAATSPGAPRFFEPGEHVPEMWRKKVLID